MNSVVFSFLLLFLSVVVPQASSADVDQCLRFYFPETNTPHRSEDTDRSKSWVNRKSNEFRNFLVEQYLHFEVTTQKDREEFIQSRSLSKHSNRIVIEFENSKLKFLNDHIKDKDLITSIDNYANLYILKHVENAMADFFPGTQVKKYSDGKSLTLILEGISPFHNKHREKIDEMFNMFQEKLVALLKEKKIFRASDKIEEWFRMGVGHTADEAYFAARRSRILPGLNRVILFSDKETKIALETALQKAVESPIFESERIRPLLDFDSVSQKYIPNIKLFDLLRKSPTVEILIEGVYETFKQTILREDAELLISYGETIDLLNPKFFVVDQTVVTLANAVDGGVVVDRKGMGSANQYATALAVARSHSPNSFFRQNRQEEAEVTNAINAYRRQMELEFGAKCRGDDCVIESLAGINKKEFLNSDLVKGQRIVFVPSGIAQANVRSEMSTHGEAIEKLFIKNLYKKLGREVADTFTFAVDFQTVYLGQGSVELIINPITNIPTSNGTRALIRESFKTAIEQFNAVQKEQKKETFYYSGHLIAL